MSSKKQLGQYFTTNYEYIMSGFSVPDSAHVIEPFVGNGNLIPFIRKTNSNPIRTFDIDPRCEDTITRDTLLDPPNYEGKYVVTNPPYLARNKSNDKVVFDKYKCNDLYKAFLITLIEGGCCGGIVIVPLNFWCGTRKADRELRKRFLSAFEVKRVNVFEEQVFSDTKYTVCSFSFERGQSGAFPIHFYPSDDALTIHLSDTNDWIIGGEIYKLPVSDKYKIYRITKHNRDDRTETSITVKCIDGFRESMISCYISDLPRVDETDKGTNRTYMTVHINPSLSSNKWRQVAEYTDRCINEYRRKYRSLFLLNYRESSDIARKRIPFDLVYRIIGHALLHIG